MMEEVDQEKGKRTVQYPRMLRLSMTEWRCGSTSSAKGSLACRVTATRDAELVFTKKKKKKIRLDLLVGRLIIHIMVRRIFG